MRFTILFLMERCWLYSWRAPLQNTKRATEEKESPAPVSEQPWKESEAASRPPGRPGILKTPEGMLELQKPHPAKTLRFQAEPDLTEAQATPQAGCSSKADEMSTANSDSSESSETSVSSATPSCSQSGADSSDPEGSSQRSPQSEVSSAPDTGSKAKVSSWFPKRIRRYFAALTRGKEGSQGKDNNSDKTATNSQNRERRGSRPSHRRRTAVATERYSGPPSQDDMRWRVALSRYALLTLLGSATFVCLSVATLRLAGFGGDALGDKQQAQDDGVTDGRRPAAWRTLRTSAPSNALPGHKLTTKKGEGEPELATKAVTKPSELVPSTGETPIIGRGGEQEEERASVDDTGTRSLVSFRRERQS